MDANFPTRVEQDALAETIRIARVIARDTIARCGGVGLAAYLGALRLSVTPPKARKGVVAGSVLRGCHSRPAAGVRTHEAIELLSGDVQAEAAAHLDLTADPGCRAIDAARDALIAHLKTDDAGPADRCAREAIRDFDREVGVAVLALRSVLPRLAAKHLAAWGGPVMTLDEAITAGEDGLRKACSVFIPGDASLCTYAVRHGWVMKAIREAKAPGWQRLERDSSHDEAGDGGVGKSSATDLRLCDNVATSQAPPLTPSVEDQAIEFEGQHHRACIIEALIAKTAAAVQSKREDTDAARGVLGLVAGRLPGEVEWQPTVRRLRSVWRRSGGSLSLAVA